MELFKETRSLFPPPPAFSWDGRKMRKRRGAGSSAARTQQVCPGHGDVVLRRREQRPWQTPSPHPVLVKLLQVLEELQEPAQRHPAGHKPPAAPSSSAHHSLRKARCLELPRETRPGYSEGPKSSPVCKHALNQRKPSLDACFQAPRQDRRRMGVPELSTCEAARGAAHLLAPFPLWIVLTQTGEAEISSHNGTKLHYKLLTQIT